MAFADVLTQAFSLSSMVFLLIGVIAGLIVGILPGAGSVFALALLVPFTDGYDP